MKIGTRLVLAIGVLAIAGAGGVLLQFEALGSAQRAYERVIARDTAVNSGMALVRQYVAQSTVARHGYLVTGRASERDAILASERRLEVILQSLQSLLVGAPAQQQRVLDVEHALDRLDRSSGAEELNLAAERALDRPVDSGAAARAVANVNDQTAAIAAILDQFDREQQSLSVRSLAAARETVDRARARAGAEVLTVLVAALIAALALLTGIRAPMVELAAIAERIASGRQQVIPWRRRDEIGDVGRAIETMSATLTQREAELRERTALVEIDARLGAALNGTRDVRSVCEDGLRILAEAVGAFAGALFLRDPAHDRFMAEATFGAPRVELVANGFAPGDGLLGRAAAERRRFVLRPAPAEAPRLETATADQAAAAHLVYPVQQGDEVIGVLELACASAPDEGLVRHVDALVDTLAVAVSTALVERERDRLHDRLEVQYAEVRAREERLRAQSATLDHQARELARKNEELSRASEMKSQFIATMSHELRTPLNSILGFTELLLQRSTTLGQEDRKSLEEVRSAGRHLLSLINDILDLARIGAGRMILRRTTVAAGSIAREVLEVLQPQAQAKGIELRLEAPADAVVDADPSRLRQILLNLVGNAVKFTDRGSVTVRARPERERVRIEIADTGPGITKSDRAKLFVEFSQLDASGRRHEGSGLGLAIARELVLAHGGDIGVDSEPGVGSTFWFTLAGAHASTPAIAEPATEAPVPPSASMPPLASVSEPLPERRRRRVLLAEDHPRNARLVEAALAPAYEIEHVADGLSAVERALGDPPDVILLDLELPGLDGFEVARRLRSDARTAQIPIVAVTARALPADEARARAIGCNEFVSKPIDLPRLRAVLRTVIPDAVRDTSTVKP